MLEASDLTVSLPGETGSMRVIDGLHLRLSEGEVVDVVGPSGSGKSTMLRALSRLVPHMGGVLTLSGVTCNAINPQEWRTRVVLLPQKPALVAGSVADNLMLPWRFKIRSSRSRPGAGELRASLDMLGLTDISLERDASRLSVGQQARLAFARLWLTGPEVLLLDEADAALDEASVEALSSAVRQFVSLSSAGSPSGRGCVVRVRHRVSDGLANRRLQMSVGRLEEVAV